MAEKIYLAVREDVETLGNHIAPIIDIQIDNIYREIEMKNGEIPEEKLLSNIKSSIETIETKEKEYIDGTLSEIITNAYSIRDQAFYNYPSITKFNAPNLDTLGYQMFYGARIDNDITDETFNLGNVTTLRSQTLGGGTITGSIVNLSKIVSLESSTFNNTKFINPNGCDIVFPNVQTIGNSCWSGCTGIKSVWLPECTSHGDEMLRGITTLETVRFDKTPTKMGARMFSGCNNLRFVVFSNSDVDVIFGMGTNLFSQMPTTAYVICQNGEIHYINGAWTIVRD